jgi:hypothetical protein
MTRLCDETGFELTMDKIKKDFLDSFVKIFGFEISVSGNHMLD